MGANGKQDQFRIGFLTAIEVPDKGFVGGLLVTNHFGRPLEFQCTIPVKPNPTQEILYGPTLAPFVLGELIGTTLVEKANIKPHLVLTDCLPIIEVRQHTQTPVAFVAKPDPGKKPQSSPSGTSDASGNALLRSLTVSSASSANTVAPASTESPSAREVAAGETTASTAAVSGAAPQVADGVNTVANSAEISPLEADETQLATSNNLSAEGIRLGRQFIRFHTAHLDDKTRVTAEAHQVPRDADLCEPFDRVREALQESLRMGVLR